MNNRPLVFLHGWAQSQQVWFQQHAQFPDALFLNLPGHGGASDADADQWLNTIVAQLPEEPCLLVGWSLGGMLAMQLAAAWPEQIASLVLISTTPRFKVSGDWSHGSSDELFEGFRLAISSASPKTLNRFFALMLHGAGISRQEYNAITKAAVDRKNRVSPLGLKEGLKLLEQLDLRSLAAEIKQPTLLIHGDNDAVIPLDAGLWLNDHINSSASSQHVIFNNCGHAPFLTQAEQFNQTLHTWWLQQ